MDKRTFKIMMSERCYRFKPDALVSHAPDKPGVYEFVMFDEKLQPIILYIGLALGGTIRESLGAHLMGTIRPTADELFKISKDIYFDYVASADVSHPDEFKDIAGFLIGKNKPRLNAQGTVLSSGKFSEVSVEEAA